MRSAWNPPLAVSLLVTTVAVSAAAFDPWVEPARYEIELRVALSWAAARGADTPRLWIPLPADNAHQHVRSLAVAAPGSFDINRDALGNRFVYVEPRIESDPSAFVEVRCLVERSPYSLIPSSVAAPRTPLDPQRYLKPQRRIALHGPVAARARDAAGGKHTAGERIRALYDEVVRTMRYSKRGRGWGRGDALWACESKFGNCTDFHSLLIGMCRSQGIPARFVIGFPLPTDGRATEITGYHCWAEIYEADRGWIPVDASEARKSGRFDDYFGRLPADRIELTVGRDLVLVPAQAGPPLNFFVYPYAEVGGKPLEQVPWKLRARRLSETAHSGP